MDEKRYKRINEIFLDAADLAGESRAAFLDEACAGDAELRREVELLLSHDDPDDDTLMENRPYLGHSLLNGVSNTPIPEQIGPYRIIDKIGEGGMGAVYLAEQDQPRRRVALKMIRPGLLSSNLLKRFRIEVDMLGRLKHPGIAQIYDAGEIETDAGLLPYFAMEYVEGDGLKRFVERNEPSVRERLELAARIADGVHHAHQNGIVHRDLKPENVLVVENPTVTTAGSDAEFARLGQPKILDFGVARATDSDVQVTTMHTDAGQLVGTLTYMSPEQVIGDSRQLDTRSDIYALGVLMYEMLSGRPPFDLRHKSIPEAARIIREEEPTRLGSIDTAFRGDIDTIACKALEKDRDHRYDSAADVAADIRRYLANEPIIAHPPSTFYQLKKFARRHKGLVAGLALSFLILLAGTVISLSLAVRASRGEAEARSAAYRYSLTAAEAMGEKDPMRAVENLESIPPEFRGWEWRHLRARLENHLVEYQGALGKAMSTPDNGFIFPRENQGNIELVEALTGKILSTFRAPEKLSRPVLSQNGSWLATAAFAEQKMIVWDVASQRRVHEFAASFGETVKLMVSPDNKLISFPSGNKEYTVVDMTTGKVVLQKEMDGAITGHAFDSHGARIFVSTSIRNRLYVFSSAGEQILLTSRVEPPSSIAVSPDGACLALGEYQRLVRIVDAMTGEDKGILSGHANVVRAVTYSSDGSLLAGASEDGTIRIWNLATGKTERTIAATFPEGPVKTLAFSSDNKRIAASSDHALRIYDFDADARSVLEGHESYAYAVAFSPDCSLLASCGFVEKMRVWDGLTYEPLAVVEAKYPHHFLSFTSDGARLFVTNKKHNDDSPGILFWDTAAGLPVTAPRISGDEKLFDPGFNKWTIVPGNSKGTPSAGERHASSPDRTLLLYGVYNLGQTGGELQLRDIATNKVIRSLGHFDQGVLSTAFSRDGKRVLAGFADGKIRAWEFPSGRELAEMRGHTGHVYSIIFSPDGSRIATGGNDGAIILWDAKNFEQVLVLTGHTGYVHSVAFSADGTRLASASGDGTVRVWDSVSPAERWQQLQLRHALSAETEPLVRRLLDELRDPLDVADQLRADETLNPKQRQAALSVLLKKSTEESQSRN